MSGIFLSYRRADATGWAGRLRDSLVHRLPGVTIFMDVEEIPPGVRFADYIHDAVGSCDVLLALIGPSWLTVTNDKGTPRLDDPQDFVRLEIAAAMERGVRVVPTLVGGATMPSNDALPEPLKPLCDRQNYELADRAWEDSCNRLAKALSGIVKPEAKPPPPRTAKRALFIGGGAMAVLLAAAAAVWTLRSGKPATELAGLQKPVPQTPSTSAPSPSAPAASADTTAAVPALAADSAHASSAPAPAPNLQVKPTPNRVASNAPATAPNATPAPPAPRPAPPNANLEADLWAAAEGQQRRAPYVEYLFRFPEGSHAAAARTRAGGYWVFDAKSRCGVFVFGFATTSRPLGPSWSGACKNGKAQGSGTLTMEIPEQQRSIVSEVTLIDAMAAGPCSQEVRTAGKLRVRQKGSCHGYLEGNFVYKFDGTEEVFDADGNPDSTLVGTYTRLPNGERESQGTRTFHKTGVVFNGTDNGSVSTGTVTFKTGGSTRCTFTKGKANGSDCELRYPDGGIYRGALADDRPTGRGVMSFSSGGSFEGDFREGKFWGQGVLAFADGRKIIGGFIAGKADGDVVLVSKDGVRTTAHFVAGERDR